MAAFTEDELLSLMGQIERGEVTLEPLQHPQQVYAGPVRYRASNGMLLTLFNFANAWDYLELVEAPDGRRVTRREMEQMPRMKVYEPPPKVAWKRYGTPGYCTFLCVRCEREVLRFSEFVRGSDGVHVCRQCATAG